MPRSLTRRGFIGGVVALLAARRLPKVAPAPAPPPIRWTQLIYAAPIVYYPRNIRFVDMIDDSEYETYEVS